MRSQAGVALVSVLLIVAMATVMAVSMIQEQHASIQITRGYLSRSQAGQYALGGEELARQILHEDFALGNGVDYIGEAWSDPGLHFEFEDGEVNLHLTDLQGLININGIGDKGGAQALSKQRLMNLLAAQAGDSGVIDRLQDWIDKDTGSRPSGAEDFDYLVFDPPYRAGNGPMAHASEVRLLGIADEQYRLVEPALTALPASGLRLNVNTAPAIVLQSLSPQLTLDVAESIAAIRIEEEGFDSVDAFLQLPQLAGLGISADGLGVQSAFFEVRVIARYQDRYSYLTSLVHREITTGEQRVLLRNFMRDFKPGNSGKQSDG